MRVRVPPPASSLSLMGHDGCSGNARLCLRELPSESGPGKIRRHMAAWCKQPPTIREKEKHAHTSARSRFEACRRRLGQVGRWVMGHDGCASGAAFGIRAGEDPADYKLDCHGAKRLAMTYKEYGRAGCGTLHGGHSRVSQVRFLPRPP